MRDKMRYVRYAVVSEKALEKQQVFDALRHAARQYMGQVAYASSRFRVMKDLSGSDGGVVMYVRGYDDHVRASFSQITAIETNRVIVQSVRASGSLASLKEEKTLG